jgi:type II secretory pathway component PulM
MKALFPLRSSLIRKGFVRLIAALFLSALTLVGTFSTNIAYGATNDPNARPLKIHTFSSSHHTEQYVRVTDLQGGNVQIQCQDIGGSDSHTWYNLISPVNVGTGAYLTYYDGTGSGDHCSDQRKLLRVKIQFKPSRLTDATANPYCYINPDPAHDYDGHPGNSLSGCVSPSLSPQINFFALAYGPNSPSNPPPNGTRPLKIHTFSSSHRTEQYVRLTDLNGGNVQIQCQHTGGSDSHTWYNLISPVSVDVGVYLTYYDGTGSGDHCSDQRKLLRVKIQFKSSRLIDPIANPYCYFNPDPYHDNNPPAADFSGCISSSLTLPVQFFNPSIPTPS